MYLHVITPLQYTHTLVLQVMMYTYGCICTYIYMYVIACLQYILTHTCHDAVQINLQIHSHICADSYTATHCITPQHTATQMNTQVRSHI